ncbi:hypothetical protein O3M35_001786 [Rhynocoris fuscipes]|uniref:Uncharacterized protein n=1 Tax=Rhynocoris fuscipes TaxID=488301 RepID=A0AAW1CQD6_9HEMI
MFLLIIFVFCLPQDIFFYFIFVSGLFLYFFFFFFFFFVYHFSHFVHIFIYFCVFCRFNFVAVVDVVFFHQFTINFVFVFLFLFKTHHVHYLLDNRFHLHHVDNP